MFLPIGERASLSVRILAVAGALGSACSDDGGGGTLPHDSGPHGTPDGSLDAYIADARRLDDAGPTLATSVAAGFRHTCAVLEGGAVRCWGFGENGRLGYGSLTSVGDDEPPAAFGEVHVGGIVTQVVTGRYHTCALLQGGAVRCWGQLAIGYPGVYTVGDDEVPAEVGDVQVGGSVIQLAAGDSHTCALVQGGAVRCWGRANLGQLGYVISYDIGDDEPPSAAGEVYVGGAVTQIAAGSQHTCALLEGGSVRCWGSGEGGRLGYGNEDNVGDDETPASAGDVDVGGVVTQITAGNGHTCALLEGGAVRCWGIDYSGELGYSASETIGDDEPPASAGDVNVGGAVVQIAAGAHHTCALLEGGTIHCWGYNGFGGLGYGHTNDVGTPDWPGDVDVGGTVTQVAAGGAFTCAVVEGDFVRCWGDGRYGQLGYGNTENIGDEPGEMPPSDI